MSALSGTLFLTAQFINQSMLIVMPTPSFLLIQKGRRELLHLLGVSIDSAR